MGIRLSIDLERAGPAPAGTLHVSGRDPVAFDGWLQLLGALRAVTDDESLGAAPGRDGAASLPQSPQPDPATRWEPQ